MRITHLLLATSLFVCEAAAQTQNLVWLNDNSPTLGGGNAFPFGSEGVRYQCIVPFATLGGPAIIQDLFVAGRGRDTQIVYGDIEIRMGLTTLGAPTNNWNSNNPNPTIVSRGPLRIVFKNGAWNGIGLPAPYVYAPTQQENLCIEVIVWKVLDMGGGVAPNFYLPLAGTAASPGGSVGRAFLFQWAQGGGHANPTVPQASGDLGCKLGLLRGDGNMVVVGQGCQGSASNTPTIDSVPGTWPKVSTVFNVLLTNGKPSSIALLSLGSSDTTWGGIPLPLDLASAGAPSCFVWNNYLALLAAAVDGSGGATVALPIPPTVFGYRVFASWLNVDIAANPAGVTTSNYAKLILGT